MPWKGGSVQPELGVTGAVQDALPPAEGSRDRGRAERERGRGFTARRPCSSALGKRIHTAAV